MEPTIVSIIWGAIMAALISIGVVAVYLSLVLVIAAYLRKNGERYKEIE